MSESFGERIRRLREGRNLNQEQVARTLKVSRKAVSNYENNLREPSFSTLVRMSDLYRVSIDYLLGVDNSISINTSGLSEKEISLFKELISDVVEKNRLLRLQKYSNNLNGDTDEGQI